MRSIMLALFLCSAAASPISSPQHLNMNDGMSLFNNANGGPADKKVYVYELPPEFNHDLLVENTDCDINGSATKSVYTAETAVWKGILESKSLTKDPRQAALFYVPWLSSCYLRTLNRQEGAQFWDSWTNTYAKTLEVHKYISQNFPYWNASDGRDHIWTFVDDLGGCNAPYKEIARNSILLVHEAERSNPGQLHVDSEPVDSDAEPMPFLAQDRYQKPCFDPSKDMVIPPRVSIKEHVEKVQPDSFGRHILAFFQGLLEDKNKQYSHGVRQRLWQLYGNNSTMLDLSKDAEVMVRGPTSGHAMGDGRHTTGYLDAMEHSTFCLCPRGWAGWSPRISESILVGCIPVLLADNVRWPFENLLDYHEFSLVTAEAQIDGLQSMLHFLQPTEIQHMQRKLVEVKNHFNYDLFVPNNAVSTILQLL